MKQRRRIYYSAAQRAEIWDRWQRGESMSSIGRSFERESSSIFSVLSPSGGIRPPDRKRSGRALSVSEREEISRGLVAGRSLRAIAVQLGRAPSTISREVGRNGGADRYRATLSDQAAWDRALRPKRCKLACHPALRRTVSRKLRRKWSPEQVAGWLKHSFPDEDQYRVSHETIYKACIFRRVASSKRSCLSICAPSARSAARATPASSETGSARSRTRSPSVNALLRSRIAPCPDIGRAISSRARGTVIS